MLLYTNGVEKIKILLPYNSVGVRPHQDSYLLIITRTVCLFILGA